MKTIRTILLCLCVSSLCLGQTSLEVRLTELPKIAYGAFYRSGEEATLTRLGEIRPVRTDIRHRLRSIIPGFTPSLYYCFRGRHSPDQLSASRASFVIVLPPLYRPSDLYLLRLRQGSNGRELLATSGITAFGLSAQYSQGDRIPFDLRSETDGTLYLHPRSTLPSGEYVIALGHNPALFWDFGVREQH